MHVLRCVTHFICFIVCFNYFLIWQIYDSYPKKITKEECCFELQICVQQTKNGKENENVAELQQRICSAIYCF